MFIIYLCLLLLMLISINVYYLLIMSESKYICIRHRIIYILIPRIKYSIAEERTLKFVSPVILEQTVNV